jgi:hypothetical protein
VYIAPFTEEGGIEGGAELMEVIDRHSVLLHNFEGNLVVFQFIAGKSANFPLWYLGCGCPDQFGSGFLQSKNELLKVFPVLSKGDGLGAIYFIPVAHRFNLRVSVAKIVKAPVEVNEVPFGFAQPAIEGGKPAVGVSTVGFGPADEGFVLGGDE